LYLDLYRNLIDLRFIDYLLLSFLLILVIFRKLDEFDRDLVDKWLSLPIMLLNLLGLLVVSLLRVEL
jgi:hypothetical protein